jgi:hypothetical protein
LLAESVSNNLPASHQITRAVRVVKLTGHVRRSSISRSMCCCASHRLLRCAGGTRPRSNRPGPGVVPPSRAVSVCVDLMRSDNSSRANHRAEAGSRQSVSRSSRIFYSSFIKTRGHIAHVCNHTQDPHGLCFTCRLGF